jgi:hypothetical protein
MAFGIDTLIKHAGSEFKTSDAKFLFMIGTCNVAGIQTTKK